MDFDDTSISTPWRMFDLRTDFNPDCFQGFVCEYQKWSDFFGQIQSLIECSKKIISETTSVGDFLTVIEDSLSAGISLRDIIYDCDYSNTKKLATCYLMYAKLLRPSLFVILAKETRKLGGNMGKMVDYIQNYELPT